MNPAASPIGAEQAALMMRPVSMIVASRDAALRPHLTRALGCRLSDEHRCVTMLLPRAGSGEVLADLAHNGRIAVVFSEPTSNRTLQLKGSDARALACTPEDVAVVGAYARGFAEEIGQLGFGAEVARTLLQHDDAIVAVQFSVAEAFDQTPGPGAGRRLDAAGATP
jgi:Pyridoxamine 5'-phosphate oxidase